MYVLYQLKVLSLRLKLSDQQQLIVFKLETHTLINIG